MSPHTTWVDELILAAKIEESNSRARAAAATGVATTSSGMSRTHPPKPAPTTTTTTITTSAFNSNHTSRPAPSPSQVTPQSSAFQSLQHTAFIAPYIPYVPTGRGLGYPPLTASSLAGSRDDMMHIPTPRNKSELELYGLLARANLLQYFETFLKFGGDDVQQLSDADEDEFIEIMRLIGMTDKPLHIRRFQKALSEWRDNQSVYDSIDSSFKRPSVSSSGSHQDRSSSFSTTTSLYYGQGTSEHFPVKSSSSFLVESPAPTPTNSEGSQAIFAEQSQQQQYCTPLEVMIGAPKRLRLMDSIKPRDLTQTYHSDIPTPDARQLHVRQAIIDKRKRAKMAMVENHQPTSRRLATTLNRSYDDESKLTPTSNSPPSPKWDVARSSCGSVAESEIADDRKGDEQVIEVAASPKRKSSVRTSLLSRFNASANDEQQLIVSERLSLSPIVRK